MFDQLMKRSNCVWVANCGGSSDYRTRHRSFSTEVYAGVSKILSGWFQCGYPCASFNRAMPITISDAEPRRTKPAGSP